VTAVTPTDTPSIIAAEGYVTLQHGSFTGTAGPCAVPVGGAYCGDSVLLNLGPTPQRIKYDIDSNNNLRSTDLTTGLPQPVASNIVNMKVQYGIDSDNDGFVDKWIKAVSGPDGDFSPTGILTMSYQDLSRIKAIRIALVVKSEQFDQTLGDWTPNPPMFGDCNGYACPTAPAITMAASTSPPGNFRYRTYETIVPLRNAIWNMDKK
jgi:type IV pilus assembly protein PilW